MGFPKKILPNSLAWTFQENFGSLPTFHSRLVPNQEGNLMPQARWGGPMAPTTVIGTRAAKWHTLFLRRHSAK